MNSLLKREQEWPAGATAAATPDTRIDPSAAQRTPLHSGRCNERRVGTATCTKHIRRRWVTPIWGNAGNLANLHAEVIAPKTRVVSINRIITTNSSALHTYKTFLLVIDFYLTFFWKFLFSNFTS